MYHVLVYHVLVNKDDYF